MDLFRKNSSGDRLNVRDAERNIFVDYSTYGVGIEMGNGNDKKSGDSGKTVDRRSTQDAPPPAPGDIVEQRKWNYAEPVRDTLPPPQPPKDKN